ncbi:sugar lactone lactonase YvrE [Arthrobacter sp. V4I6]|nr:sugar lactone lactonase YvrE [Arthrobacter sp. V1I7]MDQ0852306.1 sugar lactone lactonase YvrE [Arthrobacter sp. V4I6]
MSAARKVTVCTFGERTLTQLFITITRSSSNSGRSAGGTLFRANVLKTWEYLWPRWG